MPALFSPPDADSASIDYSSDMLRPRAAPATENGTSTPIPIAGLALLIVALVLSILALTAALIYNGPRIFRFATGFRRPTRKTRETKLVYPDSKDITPLWPEDEKFELGKDFLDSPAAIPLSASAAAEAALVALHPPAPAYLSRKLKNPAGLVRRNAISARRALPPRTQHSALSRVPVPPLPPVLICFDENFAATDGILQACSGAHGQRRLTRGYPERSLSGVRSDSLVPMKESTSASIPASTYVPSGAKEQEVSLVAATTSMDGGPGHDPFIKTNTTASPRGSFNPTSRSALETTTALLSMPCCDDWPDSLLFSERWCPCPPTRLAHSDTPAGIFIPRQSPTGPELPSPSLSVAAYETNHRRSLRTDGTSPSWCGYLDTGSVSSALGAIDAKTLVSTPRASDNAYLQ